MSDRICAWKRHGETHLTPCDLNDPDAVRFDVRYPNSHGLHLEFDSLYQAERVAGALDNEHAAGKQVAWAELRNLIGARGRDDRF